MFELIFRFGFGLDILVYKNSIEIKIKIFIDCLVRIFDLVKYKYSSKETSVLDRFYFLFSLDSDFFDIEKVNLFKSYYNIVRFSHQLFRFSSIKISLSESNTLKSINLKYNNLSINIKDSIFMLRYIFFLFWILNQTCKRYSERSADRKPSLVLVKVYAMVFKDCIHRI